MTRLGSGAARVSSHPKDATSSSVRFGASTPPDAPRLSDSWIH